MCAYGISRGPRFCDGVSASKIFRLEIILGDLTSRRLSGVKQRSHPILLSCTRISENHRIRRIEGDDSCIYIYTSWYRIRYNGTIAKDCSKGRKERKKIRTTDPAGIERCVGAHNRKKKIRSSFVRTAEQTEQLHTRIYIYYHVMYIVYIYINRSVRRYLFFIIENNANNIIHSIWWRTFRN